MPHSPPSTALHPPAPPQQSHQQLPSSRPSWSLLLGLCTLLWVCVASAQQGTTTRPGIEPPPPPPGFELDSSQEPEVTIVKRGADTVEEYRIGGKLFMIKVTPPGGTPYFMIDDMGDGNFSRQNGPGSPLRPPMWIIHTF